MFDGGSARGLVLPIYLALDTSESMSRWGSDPPKQDTRPSPFDMVKTAVFDLFAQIENNAVLVATAPVSVVLFESQTTRVRELNTLAEDGALAHLGKPSGETDYAQLFTRLAGWIRADVERLSRQRSVKGPAVFVFSDGEPYVAQAEQAHSVWGPPHRALLDCCGPDKPVRVVALGFGNVRTETLCRVATDLRSQRRQTAKQAYEVPEGGSSEVFLGKLAEWLLNTIAASASAGDLELSAPEGMQRVPCGGGD